MLDALTADTFESQVGSEFRLLDLEARSLLLVEVTRFPAPPGAPRTDPFSLVFTGEACWLLPQLIHALDHPELGRLDVFLVPIGPTPTGEMRYEAVFN